MLPYGQILVRPSFSPITIQALPMRDLSERGINQTNSNLNGSFVPHSKRYRAPADVRSE